MRTARTSSLAPNSYFPAASEKFSSVLQVCSKKHQDGSQTNGIDEVSATPFKYFDLGGDILGANSRRRSLNKQEASSKLTEIFKAVINDSDIFKCLCRARTGKLGFSCY